MAPKDREADGTWIGYNEQGVIVAITNRWLGRTFDPDRSRGLLVRDALRQESAEEAMRFVERDMDDRTYDGFNLLTVDAASALLLEWNGQRRIRTLDPGVHVIVNVGADGAYEIPTERESEAQTQAANANKLRDQLTPEPGEDGRSWLDRTASTIADHEYGVCLHGDQFGTVSSSLLRLGTDGVIYRHADGPPCETSYDPVEVSLNTHL